MKPGLTLLVAVDLAASELFRVISMLASQAGLTVCPINQNDAGAASVATRLCKDSELVAVLIDAKLAQRIAMARQVHQEQPRAQIIFIATPEEASELAREMSTAPLIGSSWRITSHTADELSRSLREAVRVRNQRRHLKTTIDRFNLQLSQKPEANGAGLRRLVLSNHFLASLLIQAPDAIVAFDEHGLVLTWNPGAEALFGVAESEALGRNGQSLSGGDWPREIPRLLACVKSNSGAVRQEIACVRPNGTRFIAEAMLALVVDANGRTLAISGIVRDITKQKHAEEALRESEERFRQVAENIREVFWLTEPAKEQMIYVSPGYEVIWGRTCESLYRSPRDWMEAIHPEDRQRIFESALTKQAAGTYDEEYRITRPDGTVRRIRDRAFPVYDKQGRVYRIAGIAEDVTARAEAEEQKERLAAFAEFNPSPVMEFAADGRLLYSNAAAQTLARTFGFEDASHILPPNITATVNECLATGKPRLGLQTKLNERTITWSFFPIAKNNFVQGYGDEITERLELEAQVRQFQKMESIGRLAGGVAHDFNNLLTVIMGQASLLRFSQSSSIYTEELAQQIMQAAERGANLNGSC